VSLVLEELETRIVLTVTYHGGPLLTSVEAENYFYGPNWSSNSSLASQAQQLNGFVNYLVSGPFAAMLGQAGYGVGTGNLDSSYNTSRNPGSQLSDSTIQASLQADITAGNLKSPDANRLYVVYVQPGTVVTMGGSTSENAFYGYHNAFEGTDGHGHSVIIPYAVLPYAGAGTPLAADSVFDSLTEVSSHEIAESITDPVPYQGLLGWYDDQLNGEIADIAEDMPNHSVVLNGYLIQKVVNQNDMMIYPAQVTVAGTPVSATAGVGFTVRLATGGDSLDTTTIGNLTATIYWGDGTASAVQVEDDGNESFSVLGTHTYSSGGSFNVTVLVRDSTNALVNAVETNTAVVAPGSSQTASSGSSSSSSSGGSAPSPTLDQPPSSGPASTAGGVAPMGPAVPNGGAALYYFRQVAALSYYYGGRSGNDAYALSCATFAAEYAQDALSSTGVEAAEDWYYAYQFGYAAQYYAYLDYAATGDIYSLAAANDAFYGQCLAYASCVYANQQLA
jgi:hypothetical protein